CRHLAVVLVETWNSVTRMLVSTLVYPNLLGTKRLCCCCCCCRVISYSSGYRSLCLATVIVFRIDISLYLLILLISITHLDRLNFLKVVRVVDLRWDMFSGPVVLRV
ncbi:hypothetical protein ACJX0J_010000, partial [Zea mays]